MPIYIEIKKHDTIEQKNNNKAKKMLIIIPKKFIKKAVDRNKIRRRIKAILLKNNINGYVVKYFCNDVKSYQQLKSNIEATIQSHAIKKYQ